MTVGLGGSYKTPRWSLINKGVQMPQPRTTPKSISSKSPANAIIIGAIIV